MAPRIDANLLRRFAESALSALGDTGEQMLRQAGYSIPDVTGATLRKAAQKPAGIFKAPVAEAGERAVQGTYRLGREAAQKAAPKAQEVLEQTIRAVAPARRAEPPVMGVFTPPASPAVRSVVEAAPDIARTPTGAPEAPVPLDGRQLDLFSGFNRLTYPKGTVTAEGTKVGGLTYNPADVMPEGESTQFVRELARKYGIDEDLALQQMRNPGPSLADEMYGQEIPRGTGLFSSPTRFGVYQARNLIGSKVADLAQLARENPDLVAGGAAGLAGLGLGTYALTRPSSPAAPETPAETPMGPTTETVDAGGLINDPEAAQNRIRAIQQVAAAQEPGARAQLETPTYRGADGQTVIVTRGENEALRSAKQQYAKPSQGQEALQKYYRQRQAYATYPQYREEVISELTKRNVLDTPELVTWAKSNPTLAYELLRKATGSTTLPSQQSAQVKQTVIGTPMGTNTTNNAVGNATAAGLNAATGTQAASELTDATRPQVYEQIQPLDPRLIYGSSLNLLR
jgi:hypothetical protein